jgi:hypothetical protein
MPQSAKAAISVAKSISGKTKPFSALRLIAYPPLKIINSFPFYLKYAIKKPISLMVYLEFFCHQ